jgi:hypothetical protein
MILTLTTPGTAQPFADPSNLSDLSRRCRELDIKLITAGATVYIGKMPPLGVGNAVSSTNYDLLLDDTTPTVPIGYASTWNEIDLAIIYWDSDTAGAKIAIAPEQT